MNDSKNGCKKITKIRNVFKIPSSIISLQFKKKWLIFCEATRKELIMIPATYLRKQVSQDKTVGQPEGLNIHSSQTNSLSLVS